MLGPTLRILLKFLHLPSKPSGTDRRQSSRFDGRPPTPRTPREPMNRIPRAALALSITLAAPLAAQQALPPGNGGAPTSQRSAHASAPTVRAVARTVPVEVDGALDEGVWSAAPAATDFTQQDPKEGQPATQRTEVRFAYDDEALYVGARMYDS